MINIYLLLSLTATPMDHVDHKAADALSNGMTAAYYQIGLDKDLERLQHENIPKPVEEIAAAGLAISNIVTQHKVTYTWTF